MRQNQLGRGKLTLLFGGKVPPFFVYGQIWQNTLAPTDQIQIKRSHSPTLFPLAAKSVFDTVQDRQQIIRTTVRFNQRGCIYVIRPGPGRKTGRFEKPADRANQNTIFSQCVQRIAECHLGTFPSQSEICAQCQNDL